MAKKTDYYKRLGEQVSEIRKRAKMSQARMAEILDIDRALISRFESQGEKLPAERIDEMLDVLGYELAVVEKKKLAEKLPLKQRLQRIASRSFESRSKCGREKFSLPSIREKSM